MPEYKNITPLNSDGERHGYWESYYSTGTLMFKGDYLNDVPHGYWEVHWSNGNLMYKGNFRNGENDGYWESYQVDGLLDYNRFYARM